MNTTVVILFVVGMILSVGFLFLVMSLVPAINQLKLLVMDLRQTSQEVRALSRELKETNQRLHADLAKVDGILDSSLETVDTVRGTLKGINKIFFKNYAGLLALIPAIRLGWNLVKKQKGGKDVE